VSFGSLNPYRRNPGDKFVNLRFKINSYLFKIVAAFINFTTLVMKKVILISITIFLVHFCFAQVENVDSLLNLLHHHQKDDTAKVSLMNKIANAYAYSNYTKGQQMADSAIALATKLDNKSLLADGYYTKGVNQNLASQFKPSLDNLQKALTIYENIGDKKCIVQTLNYIARAYDGLLDNKKAIEFSSLAVTIAETLNDKDLLGDVYNNLANDYKSTTKIAEATEFYVKALKAYEQAKDENGIGKININLGNIFTFMNEPYKAISYHQRALEIFQRLRNKRGMWYAYHNLGGDYTIISQSGRRSLPELTKALDCYHKSMVLAKDLGFDVDAENEKLGITYNEMWDHDSAIFYLKKALRYADSVNSAPSKARCLTYLGNSILYATPYVLKKHKFDPAKRFMYALAYQHRAIELSKIASDLEDKAQEWDFLTQIFEKQKRYDSALFAFRKFRSLEDSAHIVELSKQLTSKMMQYNFDKREDSLKSEQQKKQALAKSEIGRQKAVKNEIAGVGVTLLLSSIISFVFYKRRRDAKQLQKDAEFTAKVSDTEMKALRSQMNPHFIFNSLNSISDYIKKNNIGAADDYLIKFAQLMRLILENSEKKEVSLSSDLKALELYMQLESERLNHKFSYQITIDKDIDPHNTLIPPLLLQPFVENSIWHGLADKQGDGKILIHIKKDGDMINCIVEDDGVGLQDTADEKTGKKSLGMKITRARIEILNRTKNANASLQLFPLQQGTRAEVKLPLQLSF